MSNLKPQLIRRPKAVPSFTGVGALMENDGRQILFVCGDEATLRDQVSKLMTQIDPQEINPQPLTVIQAK